VLPRLLLAGLLAVTLAACSAATAPTEGDRGIGGGAGSATATPATPDSTEPPTVDPHLLVVYARYGMPPATAERALEVDRVLAAAHLRSGTVDLLASHASNGTAADDLADRWRIPLTALAVDPSAASQVIQDADIADVVARLQPGEAVLPSHSAERRGLDVGGTLRLAGDVDLTVVAIVDDPVFRSAEVVVHLDHAEALNIRDDGALVIVHDGTPDEQAMVDLVAIGPDGLRTRVATIDDPPLVLGLPEIKDRFGEFAFRDDTAIRDIHPQPAWVSANVTIESVPILGRIRCHRDVFDDVRGALQAIADAGLADHIRPRQYGGCYHPRRMGSHTESLSRHSWGIAIDLNVDMNLPGRGPVPDQAIVDIMAQHGFVWGGHFLAPDNHHYEWVGRDNAMQGPPRVGAGQTPYDRTQVIDDGYGD
jgi:hypothetical protein